MPTLNFFIFGSPVSHSKSPAMHNAAFSALSASKSPEIAPKTPENAPKTTEIGPKTPENPEKHVQNGPKPPQNTEIRRFYSRFECENASKALEKIKEFETDYSKTGDDDDDDEKKFGGASVTMPLKIEIIPLLGTLGPGARAVGAVNTVFWDRKTGELCGENTDYIGILKPISRAIGAQNRADFSVLVLGAGGTARAAGLAGIMMCDNVLFVNRTPEKAEKLAAELSESVKKVPEFAEFRGNFTAFEDQKSAAEWAENGNPPIRVVVSTLPKNAAPVLEKPILDSIWGVLDAIYDPPITPLLAQIHAKYAENAEKYAKNGQNGTENGENGTKNTENGAKTTENDEKTAKNTENGTENTENGSKNTENGSKNTKNAKNGTKNTKNGTQNTENGLKNTENGTKNAENGTKPPENETFSAFAARVRRAISLRLGVLAESDSGSGCSYGDKRRLRRRLYGF
eukprot:TRINITY_DN226_c0_g1_i10.p1 TRINITY_DN226_c0_g1~~TRINITY_DN226_c0_g1_i10.p1  ORF type:complete len:457 (-),score=65.16 TRINITY_DN226_c0_g1_i10:137-1507(-)